jgi:hypothetical protein
VIGRRCADGGTSPTRPYVVYNLSRCQRVEREDPAREM